MAELSTPKGAAAAEAQASWCSAGAVVPVFRTLFGSGWFAMHPTIWVVAKAKAKTITRLRPTLIRGGLEGRALKLFIGGQTPL
jgi:hypothetical protein